MDAVEELQAFGFGEPQVDEVQPVPDEILPERLKSRGYVLVRVFFQATEPEMVVRCRGGKGVALLVALEPGMVDDEDFCEGLIGDAAEACLQQLDEHGAT